ncbi:MAG: 4-hydroxy-3-methylbut-2-enyl diphosphate reductase [Kiritimatiellaeota bacterium]|nr:4-hydroxy-3-methylbut-2-enyl diphosphate reductase [Kiritimatiellota bacterium]
MRVVVAPSAGFCRGVRNAVARARECAKCNAQCADFSAFSHQPSALVFTDGPLIHNPQMMEMLGREGVLETDTPEGLPGGATLMIRAHGIAPGRRAFLRSLPLRLVDATCPDVARIQSQIRAHARRGMDIVIYGDHGHAEVEGLLGFSEGRGHVVDSVAEVEKLDGAWTGGAACLVAQSTQCPLAYAAVAEAARRRWPGVVVLDTICDATKNRQREVAQLAEACDALVVVGGHRSANTLRLVELARTFRPTFHIETASELRRGDFRAFHCAGLTGGASTPDFALDDARRALESF